MTAPLHVRTAAADVGRDSASNDEVTVYLDVKSPHAYLILGPALQIAVDYDVRLEFKPYQLDFVEMGISLRHDADGVRHSPSEQSDRRARMFYATAREYAALQGLQIRGPPKLLPSRLGNLAFMYARGEHAAAAAGCGSTNNSTHFLQSIFDAGWPNGWRDYDLESADVLQTTLAQVPWCKCTLTIYMHSAGLLQPKAS